MERTQVFRSIVMIRKEQTIIRCAIYTRKSCEDGLEQDFNSRHIKLITRTDSRKDIRRRMPVKDFHRPIINHVLNSTNFIIRNQVEVRSFREKLSQNFVAIFYRALFPTVVCVAEKTLAIQQLIYQ